MKAAALLVILAILTAIVAGAQCVVACAQPASLPPCHHTPQKAAKTCDSSLVFDERRPVTVIDAPSAGPVASHRTFQPPAHPGRVIAAAAGLRLHPPGASAPFVLRI
uniref:Secreted protein n=1 Tax=Solibacter usitatus (strain Ellin6076) TaxID=234267 RepID=Q01WV1_SOLUE